MRHSHTLRVGPVSFRIGSDWEAPVDHLRRLYAGYPAADSGQALATVRLEATRPWRRFVRPSVHIRGDYTIPDALPLPLSQGLLAAEMGMNLQVALGWRQHLLLHASAVERDGCCIVMVGASGSGKSTLAALLGESEWRLMGDEFALLGLDDGAINAFPRLVSLKNAAITEMVSRVPADRLGPPILGTPKGTIRHLVPRADAIVRMDEPARPSLLLFPTFGDEPGLRPVPPSEAFMRLTDSSTNYVALGEPGFDALVRLVRDVPAVAIGYGSSHEGMAVVNALWAELGR
ncbi:HprK-related kinase A [Sphingomonas lacunae]|uniref:HprK-related kinase A n=1 Tax=Sphingomonas lacunae TaxID=2698828 RepID=A0A6M4ATQ6_9SPHN|nr:HprK-related kinase A [Sphingomonas lacunae]QJQ32497.1 HprK-related kinase A [Sphingomonas lacunae]